MPSAGFEPTIPRSERPQTHTLDRAATGIGFLNIYRHSDNQSIQILQLSLCSHCVPYILQRNQGKFWMSCAHSTLWSFFDVYSTVHHSIELFHQPNLMHNFYSLTICLLHYYPRHVSSINMPIFRRKYCIHTASGIFALCKRLPSTLVENGLESALNQFTG